MLPWFLSWFVEFGDLVWWGVSLAVGGVPTLMLLRLRRTLRAKPAAGTPADVLARRWFALVLVVSAIGGAGLWFGQATATLCGLIGAYAAASVYGAYRKLVAIGKEQRVCGEAKVAAKTLQSHQSIAERLPESAAKRVLLVVKNLGSKRAESDVATLVHEEIAPFDSDLEVVQADAQVTQAMGLLGTLIGMAMLFAGLQAAIANPDPVAASTQAADSLGSLGTAFYTTIGATFGANLLLLKLHSDGYRAVRRLEAELIALLTRSHFN